MNAWEMASYCLLVDLLSSTDSYSAVVVSTSHSEKQFYYPNRPYLVEPLNGAWGLLQLHDADPAVGYGEFVADSEADVPGGKGSYDAVAVAGTCVGADHGSTVAGDDFVVVAGAAGASGAAVVNDGKVGGGAVVFVVGFEVADCAVAAADDKFVAVVEIRGGTYLHSGLGCPTLDCHHCRTTHWIEVFGSLWHCGTGHVALQSCRRLHHLCPQGQEKHDLWDSVT